MSVCVTDGLLDWGWRLERVSVGVGVREVEGCDKYCKEVKFWRKGFFFLTQRFFFYFNITGPGCELAQSNI